MNTPRTTLTGATEHAAAEALQFVTFHCGDLLVGLDLAHVQEINRQHGYTEVPETPAEICGVINLRGEVITMIDLRTVLSQPADSTSKAHNVFVRDATEVIGLVTDGVSDIRRIPADQIEPPPANVRDVDTSFFRGIYTTDDNHLVMILDLNQVLDCCDRQPQQAHHLE